MKKYTLIPLFAFLVSGTAVADDHQGLYVGVKHGRFTVDIEDANDPTDSGFLLGYNFGNGGAIEIERNSADIEVEYNTWYRNDVSLDLTTTALYYAFRSEGTAFFKFKAGVLKEDVSAKGCGSCSSIKESDTGLSAGIGGGFNIGPMAQFEAEYTILETDVDFLSVGLNLRF
ncbi:MAG: porin family protein [Pseudomonadales bacterium]|nr:porin family protein [Pseudomonadales bacterium]